MVVDHGEEVGLAEFPADDDERAVHAVGLPQIVDELGLEAAAVFGEACVLFKAVALKEPIETVFRRSLVRGRKDLVLAGELHEYGQADCRVLLAECDKGGFELLTEGSAGSPILPWLGLQALDPLARLRVERDPPQNRRPGDR